MAQSPEFLQAPATYTDLIDSQFIKAADLQGRKMTLTIARVCKESVTTEIKGKTEVKEARGTIIFEKAQKRWMLNRTNVLCLVEMFGPKTGDWVGKRVTLYAAPFSSPMFPEIKEAIRVWGSPDIAQDINFGLRLPFKKPQPVTLHKVGPSLPKSEPQPDAQPFQSLATEPQT